MAEQAIRHASAVKPITIPVNTDVTSDNLDRVQSISGGVSQPSENVYEIGRLDKVCTDKGILEQSTSITQLEYGKIDAFLQFAGLTAEPVGGLELNDFNTALTDIYQPGKTEYGGTVEQTLWLQKTSVESIGLDIADAEAQIERSFELSGDKFKILKDANKYLIFKDQLYRIRSGVATELELTTDYTYTNGTNILNIISGLAGDNYRIWYSAGSYGSAGDPFVLNDADECFIKADSVTVIINDGTHADVELDLLTSLSMSATLNRINEAVIGSDEKILRDVQDYEVSWSLDGRIKDSTIEEVLMGQAGQSHGIIDPALFTEVSVTIKIYEDSTKSNFLIGYKSTGLAFSDESRDFDANEFGTKPVTLTGTNLLITESEGNL